MEWCLGTLSLAQPRAKPCKKAWGRGWAFSPASLVIPAVTARILLGVLRSFCLTRKLYVICDVHFLPWGEELTPSDPPHSGFVPPSKEKSLLRSSSKRVRITFFSTLYRFMYNNFKKLLHLCNSKNTSHSFLWKQSGASGSEWLRIHHGHRWDQHTWGVTSMPTRAWGFFSTCPTWWEMI